jgi:hypothetical protein
MKTAKVDVGSLLSSIKGAPWFVSETRQLVKIFRLDKIVAHTLYTSNKKYEMQLSRVNGEAAATIKFDISESQVETLFGPADIIIGGYIVFHDSETISFIRANNINTLDGYNNLDFTQHCGSYLAKLDEDSAEKE